MRTLITALLLGAFALAPGAAAQTAGPSVPTGKALDGQIKTPAPKLKRAKPAAKKRLVRHTARRSPARAVIRAKAAPRRAPVKHTTIGGPRVALTV